MLTPYSPSGEEFLAALTAYFDKYGPQLMSGNVLSRGQKCIRYASEAFQRLRFDLTAGSRLSHVYSALPPGILTVSLASDRDYGAASAASGS